MISSDVVILEAVRNTHGVVSSSTLQSLGLSPTQIADRRAAGFLRRIHHGVYLVHAFPVTFEARSHAALMTSSRLVLSARTAAKVRGFGVGPTPVVELVTTSSHRPLLDGCRVRSTAVLPLDHWSVADGLRVTTPARALFDSAAVVGRSTLRRMIHRAVHLRCLEMSDIRSMIDVLGTQGHRGGGRLREVVEELFGDPPTESPLEDDVIELLERFGLPAPRRQVWFDARDGRRLRVDLFYPHEKVVIEAEGRLWHSHPDDFQDDIERDQIYAELGLVKIPVSRSDVLTRGARVASIVHSVLIGRRAALVS